MLLTVFTLGFTAAVADQLVHYTLAGDAVGSKGFLRCANGLGEGLQADALAVFGQEQLLARLDAQLLPQLRRDDDAACRIDTDAGGFG